LKQADFHGIRVVAAGGFAMNLLASFVFGQMAPRWTPSGRRGILPLTPPAIRRVAGEMPSLKQSPCLPSRSSGGYSDWKSVRSKKTSDFD
jgi:hypothetical protein